MGWAREVMVGKVGGCKGSTFPQEHYTDSNVFRWAVGWGPEVVGKGGDVDS